MQTPPIESERGNSQERHDERGRAPSTHIEQFAAAYRLKVSRDECGDPIIQGKRGHLYFDGDKLCAMFLDARPMSKKKLAELGGKLWMGDKSRDQQGTRRQDVEITGIPPEKHPQAIRIVGAKARRILSEAQRLAASKALAKAQAALNLPRTSPQEPRHGVERDGGA